MPISTKLGTKHCWVKGPRPFPRGDNFFTFSSSPPEPLGPFQPNLAQSILGPRGFKQEPHTLQRGDNLMK